jgi:hypothetical protein
VTDDIAVLGLGAACIVPGLGLLWRSASLRGDLFNKWAERVDITHAGLTERAVRLLRELQTETDRLLGDPTDPFVPLFAIADPAPLSNLTSRFHKCLRARRRLKRRFKAIVILGSVCPSLVGFYVLGAVAALSYFADWQDRRWIGITGLSVSGAAIGLGAIVVLVYVYLNTRLTTAEIMGRSRPGDTGGGAG